MKQSRSMSLAESIANVAVGYGVALATPAMFSRWRCANFRGWHQSRHVAWLGAGA